MKKYHHELHDNKLIDSKLHQYLDAIESNSIVSVYTELRLLLYVGILLFTGGVGYFAYQNIGDAGHILLQLVLFIAIILGLVFLQKHAQPFTRAKSIVEHSYFDYILLLVSLLCISLFTYVLVYFNWYEQALKSTSFISAILFFAFAYRYDNKAVLSIAITVLVAALGISISPVNWIQGEWNSTLELYNVGICISFVLLTIGKVSDKYNFKSHFKFTYQNYGYLILYISLITSIIESDYDIYFALSGILCTSIFGYFNWYKKDFLFFMFSCITFYICFSYALFKLIDHFNNDLWMLYFYYVPGSIIVFILFLVNKKSHFKHD